MLDSAMYWISLLALLCLLQYGGGAEMETSCIYPMLENGYFLHSEDIFRPDQGTVYVGSKMIPICGGMGASFVLVGSGSLECNSDGKWTPNPFPECYLAKAGCEIKSFENGVIRLGSSDAQWISFKCNPGFKLMGPETLSCGLAEDRGPSSGQQWTKPVPYCQELPPTTTTTEAPPTDPPTTTPAPPTTPRPRVKAYQVVDSRPGYCQGAIWHICDCNLTCVYIAYTSVILCVPVLIIICLAPLLYRASSAKAINNVSIRPNASKFVKRKPPTVKTDGGESGAPADDYLVPVCSSPEPRYGPKPLGGSTEPTLDKQPYYEDCV